MTLELARRLIDEGGRRGTANRAAATLARFELERLVEQRVCARHAGMRNATQRSKLIVLAAREPTAGGLAAAAWDGLSRACHQHAYDLSPTASEVVHLIDLVERFAATEIVGTRS